MAGRNFSEAIQFGVVKANLEKHNGKIQCELCGKQIFSIGDCHFDHIIPYAKGGTSTLENCQILCIECNLKKSDKELKEIALEEKARQFLSGKSFKEDANKEDLVAEKVSKDDNPSNDNDDGKMTKEKFDRIVGKFIEEKGDIRQIDFSREYNHLPGISYMVKYYGTLNELKKSFGITDISLNWNRENIKEALVNFVSTHGKITQKDIRKENLDEARELFRKYFSNNSDKIPESLYNSIKLKYPDSDVVDSLKTMSPSSLKKVLEAGGSLHENLDGTVTYMPTEIHSKVGHMGGAAFEAWIKQHMGKIYFETFVSAAASGAVVGGVYGQ